MYVLPLIVANDRLLQDKTLFNTKENTFWNTVDLVILRVPVKLLNNPKCHIR